MKPNLLLSSPFSAALLIASLPPCVQQSTTRKQPILPLLCAQQQQTTRPFSTRNQHVQQQGKPIELPNEQPVMAAALVDGEVRQLGLQA